MSLLHTAAAWEQMTALEEFRPDTTVPSTPKGPRRAWARITQSGISQSMVFDYDAGGKGFYISEWFPDQAPGAYMTVAPSTSDKKMWTVGWTSFKSDATLFDVDTVGIRAVRFAGSQDITLYLLVKDGQPYLYPRPVRCPSNMACMNAPPPKVTVKTKALCA